MLPVYEEIIRTGAWWDLVDGVAHRSAPAAAGAPERADTGPAAVEHGPGLLDPAVVHHGPAGREIQHRHRTPAPAVIEANLADREFFIRKAIGWALREYAKTDPAWVRQFVRAHGQPQPAFTPRGAPEPACRLTAGIETVPAQMTGRAW